MSGILIESITSVTSSTLTFVWNCGSASRATKIGGSDNASSCTVTCGCEISCISISFWTKTCGYVHACVSASFWTKISGCGTGWV